MTKVIDPKSSPNIDIKVETHSVELGGGSNTTLNFDYSYDSNPKLTVLPDTNATVGYTNLSTSSVDITTGSGSTTQTLVVVFGE